ncbi:transposase [Streptococcus pneumoniae BHN427]|nr:transposase [Streptococcus pneumoniae BHN427]
MEQLHFITKLLDIKDPNIQILDIIKKDTHKEIIAKLDYEAPSCPECGSQMKKYYFQKPSKIPYLETTGIPYYDLAKQLRFQISRLRLKQSPRLFHSRMLKSFLIAFTLYNILAVL